MLTHWASLLLAAPLLYLSCRPGDRPPGPKELICHPLHTTLLSQHYDDFVLGLKFSSGPQCTPALLVLQARG